MVSAGAQLILQELEERGHALEELDKYAVVHINDTHPSMVIPELIRLLTERGVELERAMDLVERTCAYTCLLYTSPSPRDVEESRMPSSA